MAINKAFVVKHGLEVNQDLILANALTKKVGIGSTNPRYNLDVRGGIGATDVIVSGIATVLNELRVGTGGTIFSVIAGPTGFGQSVGVGTANPGYLLDVRSPVSTGQTALYVQGDVRITGDLNVGDDIFFDEFTARNINVTGVATIATLGVTGLTTTQNLQVIGVTTTRILNVGTGGTIITTTSNGLVGIGTTNPTSALTVNGNVSIAGVTSLGTAVNKPVVIDENGFMRFPDRSGGYGGLTFGDGADLEINASGTTANLQTAVGSDLRVVIGSNTNYFEILGYNSGTEAKFIANSGVELYYANSKKFQTLGAGVTITGTTFTNQLNSSGVATASAYYVNGTSVINNSRQLQNIASLDATTTATIESAIANAPNTFTDITVSGVSTFVGLATFNNGLRVVSGVTTLGVTTATNLTLQQLNVSGLSTFAGITTVTGSTLFSKQLNVSGVSTLGIVQVSSGIITASSGIVTYYGDGSYLTGNARNLTATIGIGTSGNPVGYGVSFLDLRGPGLSTVTVDSNVGVATIYFQGGGGGATIGIGTTPGEAFTGIITAGNLWYNSTLGRTFIYYQDTDSAQWVDASPSNVGVITSLINVSFAPGSATSPSMYFVGDSQTGFFSPSAGQFTVVSAGSSILNINPSGINVTGVATAQDFDALSDINYKENINTVNGALLKVEQMRGVKFNWKESGSPSYGVIAQELQEVLPELVHGEDPKTVNYNGIIGVLIEAIKELKAEVEELKNS